MKLARPNQENSEKFRSPVFHRFVGIDPGSSSGHISKLDVPATYSKGEFVYELEKSALTVMGFKDTPIEKLGVLIKDFCEKSEYNFCYVGQDPSLWKVATIHGVIENVHAMRRGAGGATQGVSSSFKFGRAFGAQEMALSFVISWYSKVSPQKWQKVLDSRTGGDKKISKEKVEKLISIIENRAWIGSSGPTQQNSDSVLLAIFCFLRHGLGLQKTMLTRKDQYGPSSPRKIKREALPKVWKALLDNP